MKTTAEIRVEALGGNTSMRDVVERARAVLDEAGLQFDTHELGTNVEGEMSDVLHCVEQIHQRLHEQGCARLSTHLRLGTRSEAAETLQEEGLDPAQLPDAGQPPRLA